MAYIKSTWIDKMVDKVLTHLPRTNCNNCGAVLEDGYCPYCQTRYFFVEPVKITHPKKVEPFKEPKAGGTILFADGKYLGTVTGFPDMSMPQRIETTGWFDRECSYSYGLSPDFQFTLIDVDYNFLQYLSGASKIEFECSFPQYAEISFAGVISNCNLESGCNEVCRVDLTIVVIGDPKVKVK